jgi:AraC-like DNA-binding protein
MPWSCTSANYTGPRTTPNCSAARSAPARRLLGSARWDARNVAAHLGFTDPANFGRFIRDRTGLTPAALAAREAASDPILHG